MLASIDTGPARVAKQPTKMARNQSRWPETRRKLPEIRTQNDARNVPIGVTDDQCSSKSPLAASVTFCQVVAMAWTTVGRDPRPPTRLRHRVRDATAASSSSNTAAPQALRSRPQTSLSSGAPSKMTQQRQHDSGLDAVRKNFTSIFRLPLVMRRALLRGRGQVLLIASPPP
jgi:hypothetical protein